MIAFVGSVFSPYYRRAWRQGSARAEDHCALNVALYSPGAGRWTMTERSSRTLRRTARRFQVGPSAMSWERDSLVIDVDEVANPLPRPVRGRITLHPRGLSRYVATLDDAGRHRWGPIAPCARVEVALESPSLRWSGHAYLDSNEGDEPITEPFTTWDWMRAPLPDGSTVVAYDVRQRSPAGERLIGTRFSPTGEAQVVELPGRQSLPGTGWRIARAVRGEPGHGEPAVLRTLEDTPFYARSIVRTRLLGSPVVAMHESLSADRYGARWVQALLPWRMPRRP